MSYDEEEEVEGGFKVGGDEDDPLEPEDMPVDFPNDDDDSDPENRFH